MLDRNKRPFRHLFHVNWMQVQKLWFQFHDFNLASLTAEEPEEDALELVPEDAIDDEVDGGVERDEQVGDVVHPNVFDVQNLVRIIGVCTGSLSHLRTLQP